MVGTNECNEGQAIAVPRGARDTTSDVQVVGNAGEGQRHHTGNRGIGGARGRGSREGFEILRLAETWRNSLRVKQAYSTIIWQLCGGRRGDSASVWPCRLAQWGLVPYQVANGCHQRVNVINNRLRSLGCGSIELPDVVKIREVG